MQKTKLKIIYFSDDFPPENNGGAGMIAHEEAFGISKEGHNVLVITTTPDISKVGGSKDGDVRILRLYSKYHPRWRSFVSVWNFKLVGQIEHILKKEMPDIVHAHNIHTNISFKILDCAARHAKKVFITAHDAMFVHYGKFVPQEGLKAGSIKNYKEYGLRYNPLRLFFIKRYLKKVHIIFAVSNALKNLLESNGIRKVEVLHNGIDESRWQNIDEKRKDEYSSLWGLRNKKVILFAGRIGGLKGGKVLKSVFKRIHDTMPEARLLIVGKNDGMSKVDGVIYTGPVSRDDMKYVYALSHVVTVPSLYLDPFPTINLEAMACAKPVVGTSLGGTPEAVLDGVTGYIVDPRNEIALEKKIVDLLSNPLAAENLGKQGRMRFADHFTLQKHLAPLLVWYNS